VSERTGQDIDIELSDGGNSTAYLATPASGRGPGVVVIQEWWGLVDQIRDVCDRLAREGFVALAPDIYRGESTTDPDVAGRLMMDLQIDRAAVDLDAAVAALQGQASVDGAKVGCIGFCMGGQLALLAASRNAAIGACVDCYGVHPNVTVDPSGLEAAVFGVFAENDDFIPLETVRSLETQLRDAGKRVNFEIFVGTQHAFLNDARPDVFDAKSAESAWNQILAFFAGELR
jgi:carboxymethylenebutenolidase